jgi:hypothetical protein
LARLKLFCSSMIWLVVPRGAVVLGVVDAALITKEPQAESGPSSGSLQQGGGRNWNLGHDVKPGSRFSFLCELHAPAAQSSGSDTWSYRFTASAPVWSYLPAK